MAQGDETYKSKVNPPDSEQQRIPLRIGTADRARFPIPPDTCPESSRTTSGSTSYRPRQLGHREHMNSPSTLEQRHIRIIGQKRMI